MDKNNKFDINEIFENKESKEFEEPFEGSKIEKLLDRVENIVNNKNNGVRKVSKPKKPKAKRPPKLSKRVPIAPVTKPLTDLPEAQTSLPGAINADRVSAHMARKAEVGILPNILNPKRRKKALNKLLVFGTSYMMRGTYWGGMLIRPPSTKMIDYVEDLERSILGGGLLHIRIGRGAGKTTWAKIALVWGVLSGHIKYPVCFAASERLAHAILNDIWDAFEWSPELLEDFPEICIPIRKLEGKVQRCPSQTLNGVRTQIRRTSDTIQLPTVPGSLGSGAIMSARGAGAAVRGLVKRGQRPDFVLLDDIQTREGAANQDTVNNLKDWIDGDVLGLAGTAHMAAAMTSTPMFQYDLSETFADSEKCPAWRTTSYPMLSSMPDSLGLWDKYGELWRLDIIAGDSQHKTATKMYQDNRAAMDKGASVFDEEAYDKRSEISALQHAMTIRLRIGHEAFSSEYQLTPPRAETLFSIKSEDVFTKLNLVDRYVLPRGTLVPVAFIDVMSSVGMFWGVIGCGRRQTGAVVDYGKYPKHGRLCPPDSSDREITSAIATALDGVITALFDREYIREDTGQIVKLHAVWVDDGYQTHTIRRVCEMFRRRGYQNVVSCKGFSANQFMDGNGRNVVTKGFQVGMRESEGIRFAGQNSDYWREHAQRCFLGQPLQPGTLSLWGKDDKLHIPFGDHLTANILADKGKSFRGAEMYRWVRRPGSFDHWHDCISGSLACASYYRFWDADVEENLVVKPIDTGNDLPVKIPTVAKHRKRWRTAKGF